MECTKEMSKGFQEMRREIHDREGALRKDWEKTEKTLHNMQGAVQETMLSQVGELDTQKKNMAHIQKEVTKMRGDTSEALHLLAKKMMSLSVEGGGFFSPASPPVPIQVVVPEAPQLKIPAKLQLSLEQNAQEIKNLREIMEQQKMTLSPGVSCASMNFVGPPPLVTSAPDASGDLPLKLVRRGGGESMSPGVGFPTSEGGWEFMDGEPMIDHVGLGSRGECHICPIGVGGGNPPIPLWGAL